MHRIGDNDDPWGMSVEMFIGSMMIPLNRMRMDLLLRKESIHYAIYEGILRLRMLWTNRIWCTLLNALEISMNIAEKTFPSFHAWWILPDNMSMTSSVIHSDRPSKWYFGNKLKISHNSWHVRSLCFQVLCQLCFSGWSDNTRSASRNWIYLIYGGWLFPSMIEGNDLIAYLIVLILGCDHHISDLIYSYNPISSTNFKIRKADIYFAKANFKSDFLIRIYRIEKNPLIEFLCPTGTSLNRTTASMSWVHCWGSWLLTCCLSLKKPKSTMSWKDILASSNDLSSSFQLLWYGRVVSLEKCILLSMVSTSVPVENPSSQRYSSSTWGILKF